MRAPSGRMPDLWLIALPLLLVGALVFSLPLADDNLMLAAALGLPLAGLLLAILVYGAMTGNERALALLLFIAVFMVEAVFRKRAYSDKSIDIQIILKLGLWAIILIPALIMMYRTRFRTIEQIGILWIVLYGWFLITTIWAPNFQYSVVAVISAYAYLFFVTTMMANFDRFMIVRVVVYAVAFFSLVSLIVYFLVPSLGRMPLYTTGLAVSEDAPLSLRLTGIGGTANAAGFISALGLLLMSIYWRRLREMDGLIVFPAGAISASVLILSQSRMSLAAVLILSYVHHFAKLRSAHLVFLTVTGLFAFSLVLVFYDDLMILLFSRTGNPSDLFTLTGRSAIWSVVVGLIGVKPILGWGYASTVFVLTQYVQDIGFYSVSQAHNLILQLTFTAGLVGLFLFVLATADFLLRARLNGHREAITVFLFVMFVGITEPGPFFGITNAGVLALALAIGLAMPGSVLSSRKVATGARPAIRRAHNSVA